MGPKLRRCVSSVKAKDAPPPSAILSIITLGAPHQENIYSHRSSAAASSLHLKWFQQTQLAL